MKVRMFVLGTVLALGMTTVMAGPAGAAGRVIPPKATPAGASYAQWSAAWWQWFYQTPLHTSPLSSPPGAPSAPAPVDCSVGQSGHVWFLGGTFVPTSSTSGVSRSDVYRSCSVPTGTSLFFPLLNDEFDNLGCPNTTLTAAELQAEAAQAIDDIVPDSMAASIDGNQVTGLTDGNSIYRARSPWFSYTLPADNVGQLFGCTFPAGTMPPPVEGHPGATADGIYLMLTPLNPGTHLLHFGGELNIPGVFDFIQNINYTIQVVPR